LRRLLVWLLRLLLSQKRFCRNAQQKNQSADRCPMNDPIHETSTLARDHAATGCA
jgi:hypothetical protein